MVLRSIRLSWVLIRHLAAKQSDVVKTHQSHSRRQRNRQVRKGTHQERSNKRASSGSRNQRLAGVKDTLVIGLGLAGEAGKETGGTDAGAARVGDDGGVDRDNVALLRGREKQKLVSGKSRNENVAIISEHVMERTMVTKVVKPARISVVQSEFGARHRQQ